MGSQPRIEQNSSAKSSISAASPGRRPVADSSLHLRPGFSLYLGLFLITLSTLLFELGLTRIFSVILYYHMAFFAVSVTLFGMAFGGVIVHFFPRVFTAERAQLWMGRLTLAFALTTAAALAAMLSIRFNISQNKILAFQLFLVSVILAIPFTCSGAAVALALTRFPRQTNLLYGIDLAGAALGCLLFAPLVTLFGGPGFILAVALLIALAALFLAIGNALKTRGRLQVALALLATLLLGALIHQRDSIPGLQVRFMRGGVMDRDKIAFEGWNAISRVTVHPGLGNAEGVAPAFFKNSLSEQYTILIDTLAATPILKFDGKSFDKLFYPFHDISYAVHAVRKNARVAVIGTGGGRDVLAAKAWGQPEVVGIEINSRVLEALTKRFSAYAGNPLAWPGVTIVQDEARSYLARSPKKFDIIQASLIDTFAATAAGAFVLTENALYTMEGWNVFLDRLTDGGILTMTRWYTTGNPVESVRLLALARAALEARGIKNPQAHILMARSPQPANPQAQPLATILVKKTPFTDAEIRGFETWIQANQLSILVTPRRIETDDLRGVLTTPALAQFTNRYAFDISPPTDNHPFFFDVLRWRDIAKKEFRQGNNYIFSINLKPLVMLGSLLITVIAMAFAFIVIPLVIEGRLRGRTRPALPLGRRLGMMLYFIMLGLAYIMIELTLMQRFTVFLGHPGYSLTVCLFTMLLASGLGSMVAPRLFRAPDWAAIPRQLVRVNLTVFCILLVTLALALAAMHRFVAAPTALRILLAGASIAPAAFFMGMPFPLAIQAAARRPQAPLAWFWGINGAFSVCASVLTVAIAHSAGLTGAFLCGAACYLLAALAGLAFGPARE